MESDQPGRSSAGTWIGPLPRPNNKEFGRWERNCTWAISASTSPTRICEGLFAQAGVCESVAVITDKFSGQSRGFGFVEMSSAAEAQNAIKQLDGQEFKGRALKVNEAKAREDSGRRGGGWNRR